jgi:hypothetical protein
LPRAKKKKKTNPVCDSN